MQVDKKQRQIDEQIDRYIDGQIDTQIDRWIERERETDKCKQKTTHMHTHKLNICIIVSHLLTITYIYIYIFYIINKIFIHILIKFCNVHKVTCALILMVKLDKVSVQGFAMHYSSFYFIYKYKIILKQSNTDIYIHKFTVQ